MQVLKDPPCSASRYYLRSLSWTSGTFYFPDSWDLLEVLGGLPWQRGRGGSPGDPPGPWEIPPDPRGTMNNNNEQ